MAMRQFEYEITKHPADEFTDLVYFCSEGGDCHINQIPSDQMIVLGNLLNKRGSSGWELVQLAFGDGGAVAFPADVDWVVERLRSERLHHSPSGP